MSDSNLKTVKLYESYDLVDRQGELTACFKKAACVDEYDFKGLSATIYVMEMLGKKDPMLEKALGEMKMRLTK